MQIISGVYMQESHYSQLSFCVLQFYLPKYYLKIRDVQTFILPNNIAWLSRNSVRTLKKIKEGKKETNRFAQTTHSSRVALSSAFQYRAVSRAAASLSRMSLIFLFSFLPPPLQWTLFHYLWATPLMYHFYTYTNLTITAIYWKTTLYMKR